MSNMEIPPELRNKLLTQTIDSDEDFDLVRFAPNAEVELPSIEGWRFQFIPSKGPFAGQPISRVFIVPEGKLARAQAVCHLRYGASTHILAGVALHLNESFGEWDG